jgi:hypothetical protein
MEGRRNRGLVAASAWLAAAALTTAAADAGTVYVPLAGEHGVGTARYTAQVWVGNESDVPRNYTTRFVANNADGAQGGKPGGQHALAGRRSALVTAGLAANGTGLLEISGAPQLFVAAHLVANGVVRAALPVITSENVLAAGTTTAVLGFARSAAEISGFTIVNLGHAAARCAVSPWSALGERLTAPITLEMPPLTQQAYPDALAAIGRQQATGVRFTATCDQAFYAFGMLYRPATGEAHLLPPAASASSNLTPPAGGGGGGSLTCPTGATCFSRAGAFFTTTQAEPERYYKWIVPESTQFRRIEVTFQMTLNKWDKNKNGFYSLFYLPRNGKWLVKGQGGGGVGLLVARQKGVITAETTFDLPFPQLQAMRDKSAQLVPGRTYSVYYVYDAENGRWELKVTDVATGQHLADLDGKLMAKSKRLTGASFYGIQFSDRYIAGTDHVPLWATWKNLLVAGFH